MTHSPETAVPSTMVETAEMYANVEAMSYTPAPDVHLLVLAEANTSNALYASADAEDAEAVNVSGEMNNVADDIAELGKLVVDDDVSIQDPALTVHDVAPASDVDPEGHAVQAMAPAVM